MGTNRRGFIRTSTSLTGRSRATRPEAAARGAGGFHYSVLSYTGKPMSDGNPTPVGFDGMAAFPLPNGNIRLVRNHENRNPAMTARVKGDPASAYDAKAGGGTTSLEVRVNPDGSSSLVRDFISLNGTIVNCAGGPTPWGTWLTCEESTEGAATGWTKEHGYIFEVPRLRRGQ